MKNYPRNNRLFPRVFGQGDVAHFEISECHMCIVWFN